ncbi:MAG: hypothetical protein CV089_16540 [Nitrospira sp. WS110]|nr:hypothetical protein [Nitrospira sp. WS110]
MIQCRQHQRTVDFLHGGARRNQAGLLFIVALAFTTSGFSLAAGWLAPASDQAVTAPWVKDVAAQLEQEPYRDVLGNAPGEPPHPMIVRYLNNAAQALQVGNKLLAQSYVDRTIRIFESGVQRGYYSRSDVEPITKLIRERAEAAMKGEKIPVALEQERWTGYTHQEPLGLAGESDRMKREHPVAE